MKTSIDDIFTHRILICVGDRKITKEEILIKYDQMYPPSFRESMVRKIRMDQLKGDIDKAVTFLVQNDYFKTEIVSFTDRPLRYPLVMYSRTSKGHQEILGGKKK